MIETTNGSYDFSTEEKTFSCEIINLINSVDDSGEKLWTFKEIQGHKRHGSRKDKWKVKVLWDNSETSWEPLDTMKEMDTITLAHYAEKKKITKLGVEDGDGHYGTSPMEAHYELCENFSRSTRRK